MNTQNKTDKSNQVVNTCQENKAIWEEEIREIFKAGGGGYYIQEYQFEKLFEIVKKNFVHKDEINELLLNAKCPTNDTDVNIKYKIIGWNWCINYLSSKLKSLE